MERKRIICRQADRESGIELLKIGAILFIVLSHVVQTLSSRKSVISFQEYVLNLSVVTTNIQHIVLVIFRHAGVLGNMIFFICSAWFWQKSEKYNKKKWLFMLLEIWTVSVIIFGATYLISGGSISTKIMIKSFFPTLFGNNWYLTCYLLFYPIHPFLNKIIKGMSKQTLFRCSASFLLLYFGFGFINDDWFFSSTLILWVTMYLTIAYIQLYMKDFADNRMKNMRLLVLGMLGVVAMVFGTNFLGMRISFLEDKMLHWISNNNPFIFAMAIGLFNIFRNIHFKNKIVNYISKLSLLIYIIHENLILRTYYRPILINYVYENYGYSKIVLWILVLTVVVFMFGVICAVLYERTLQKMVIKVGNALYYYVKKKYLALEQTLLKFE